MNIDDKIWHSETDYYCEENDWNSSATTKLLPGTEITIYSDSDQSVKSLWFVSKTGKFILYNSYS